ncbi:hypothetical protein GGR54DRAFT_352222 [Hypoxylon sp. NC1633]|nr:hypothetical protein GGR54DRAFT_352222 [Hypoxylon sp. NC1633]
MTDPTTEHEESICCDTGCTRSLADRDWVQRHYPGTEIRKRSTPMYIRGISEKEVVTSDYAMHRFYFKGIRDGKISVATFVREVTLMWGCGASHDTLYPHPRVGPKTKDPGATTLPA